MLPYTLQSNTRLPTNISMSGTNRNPPTEVKQVTSIAFFTTLSLAMLRQRQDSWMFTSVVPRMWCRTSAPFWWIHRHHRCVSRLVRFARIPHLCRIPGLYRASASTYMLYLTGLWQQQQQQQDGTIWLVPIHVHGPWTTDSPEQLVGPAEGLTIPARRVASLASRDPTQARLAVQSL